MKFLAALASTVLAARAVRDPADQQQRSAGGKSFDIGNMYRSPDYSQPYGEALPGADFNKQVYQFRENEQIWDQNDYVERVKVEAEILVALEALKTSVGYLRDDTSTLDARVAASHAMVGAGHEPAYVDQASNVAALYDAAAKVHAAGDLCRLAASDLDDHKNALILYCQQFAFGHEMVSQCAALLTCRDTQLPYKYAFTGNGGGKSYSANSYSDSQHQSSKDGHDTHEPEPEPEKSHYHEPEHTHEPEPAHEPEHSYKPVVQPEHTYEEPSPAKKEPHVNHLPEKEPSHNFNDYLPKDDSVKPYVNEQDPSSSHGFKLHVTGDGLKNAPEEVHPEIAAAAVNPHEAVIQIGGDSILAPFEDIDHEKLELACNADGCALIPDDNNPDNDLIINEHPEEDTHEQDD